MIHDITNFVMRNPDVETLVKNLINHDTMGKKHDEEKVRERFRNQYRTVIAHVLQTLNRKGLVEITRIEKRREFLRNLAYSDKKLVIEGENAYRITSEGKAWRRLC